MWKDNLFGLCFYLFGVGTELCIGGQSSLLERCLREHIRGYPRLLGGKRNMEADRSLWLKNGEDNFCRWRNGRKYAWTSDDGLYQPAWTFFAVSFIHLAMYWIKVMPHGEVWMDCEDWNETILFDHARRNLIWWKNVRGNDYATCESVCATRTGRRGTAASPQYGRPKLAFEIRILCRSFMMVAIGTGRRWNLTFCNNALPRKTVNSWRYAPRKNRPEYSCWPELRLSDSCQEYTSYPGDAAHSFDGFPNL